MAGEGYGTTSINTGSAQVVGSPTFNIEKYAQPFIAKRKEDAVKAAAKAKSQERILGDIGKIKTIASPRYQPFIEQGKKDVLEKAKKAILTDDIYDKMALNDAQQKLNTMIDGAKKTDALYGGIGQQMLGGGNYWNKEHFDDYHKPLQTDDLSFDNFLKTATEDANKATQIRKDTYNPIKFNDDMNATARTFYGTQGNFTEQDLRDTLETMFTKDLGTDDPYHFDTYQHYAMDAKKLPDLQTKYNGDIPKAAIDLAVNDFIQLTGLKPKGKGGLTINLGGGSTTPNTSSVFEANTIFGSGDNSFTQSGQEAAAYPVKKSVASADPDSINPVTMGKVGSGEIIPTEYGSMQIVDVLEAPLDLGGGITLPAGTPVPKDKSVADIAVLYFKNNPAAAKKVFGENADEAAIKSSPEFKRLKSIDPQLGIRLFNVGVGTKGGKSIPVYTPLEKNIGAIQGGMSKDDEAKFNYQFDTIYKSYLNKGGKPLKIAGLTDRATTTGGGDKRTNAKLYSYDGADYSYDYLVKTYGQAKADKAIAAGTFKQKK
jgi:hypothetical protein